MALQKLPKGVQCLLNASARVRNFKEAIEELVYNSLDAESSSIAIRINIQRNWIQVVDNGHGIKKMNFKLLGERYATSKLFDHCNLEAAPTKYGYKGQALANIIEVSQTVKITSQFADVTETWTKIFHEGKEHDCRQVAIRPSKGTTVEINGFLFNLDIQRKSLNPFNEQQDIKTFLKQLLLVFNNLSISLRDDGDNEIIFKSHKNKDIYQTLKTQFEIDMKDLQEFHVQKNEYKVKVFIGTKDTELKKYQWIYLNNKFVDNSNLHKLINDKFFKRLGTKRLKIPKNKMKGMEYNEDGICIDEYQTVYYFMFLSVPYLDYDVVYSGKQTTIEFKDWHKINMLIEKLVNIYCGDKNINITKNVHDTKIRSIEDTKNEVKKIMEKVLGNNKLKSTVFQIKNGVKGKRAKRKKNKKTPVSSAKLKISKNCMSHPQTKANQGQDKKTTESSKKNIAEMSSQKINVSNEQLQLLKGSQNPQVTENNIKAKKRLKECKCKKIINLRDLFRDNSGSIKRIYNRLSYNVNNNLRKSNQCEFEKKPVVRKDKTEIKRNKFKNKNPTHFEENEMVINHKSSKNIEIKCSSNFDRNNVVKNTRSFDLLQTILRTQACYNNLNTQKTYLKAPKIDCNSGSHLSTCQNAPYLTYESHKYDIGETLRERINPQAFQFIRKNTKTNFKENMESNINAKEEKFNKKQSHGKRNNLNKSSYDNLAKKYKQVFRKAFPKVPHESDIIEFSKQIRKQITRDMNSFINNNNSYKARSKLSRQLNIGVNFNIESTYTIHLDSFQHSSNVLNTFHHSELKQRGRDLSRLPFHFSERPMSNIKRSYYDFKSVNTQINCKVPVNKIIQNKTPKPINYNSETYNDDVQYIMSSKNDNLCKNNFNAVSIAQSQHSSRTEELVEPLNICEAIIKNSADIEDESNDLFNSNISSNNNQAKSSIYNSLFEKYSGADIDTSDKELINCVENSKTHTMQTECDLVNSTNNNFDLRNRHSFVPKGMSPMFKSCFSKNICSYNFDMEYYEDEIYNNFVEEVAINSEIFEPNIQNVNEIATSHIQNVTNKLKKNNADLTFGKESLKKAKVLGQVDCKFIAAKILSISRNNEMSELLVLFDQHAVHERIRLEENLLYYIAGNKWKKCTIDAFSINISKDDVLYLHNHRDKFSQFGLEWTVSSNCIIKFTAIPEAIVGNNSRPVDTIVKAVKNLIFEQIHAIKCLKGNVSLYPRSIMNLVFSEACRYAIKFGDVLSKKDCSDLIMALSNCKTPFQCAHGRPVMAILMEVDNNKNKINYKANIQNIMQLKNQDMLKYEGSTKL